MLRAPACRGKKCGLMLTEPFADPLPLEQELGLASAGGNFVDPWRSLRAEGNEVAVGAPRAPSEDNGGQWAERDGRTPQEGNLLQLTGCSEADDLAVGRPEGAPCSFSPIQLADLLSIEISHPQLTSSPATGSIGDVPAIRRDADSPETRLVKPAPTTAA